MFVINALVWNASQTFSLVQLSNTSHHVGGTSGHRAIIPPFAFHEAPQRTPQHDRGWTVTTTAIKSTHACAQPVCDTECDANGNPFRH